MWSGISPLPPPKSFDNNTGVILRLVFPPFVVSYNVENKIHHRDTAQPNKNKQTIKHQF